MNGIAREILKTTEYWFRDKINLFPPPPEDMESLENVCIGTKSHNLGDALMASTLPEKLKEKYPRLKVYYYIKGFNTCVFENNPYVDGWSCFPKEVYGDDINFDKGHLIQLKENFFGLDSSDTPRPQIYLTYQEIQKAKNWVEDHSNGSSLPICILHPVGKTHGTGVDFEFFETLVSKWKDRFRFCQVGLEGDREIKGCQLYALTPKGHKPTRELFALVNEANILLGANSGPMHIAAAFEKKSLIYTQQGPVDQVFETRKSKPYYLQGNLAHLFLYEWNSHIPVDQVDRTEIWKLTEEFLKTHSD